MFLSIFCFVPSFLGEGLIQGRTANALIFNFLILYLVNVVFWKQSLEANKTYSFSLNKTKITISILSLIVLSIYSSPNYLQAIKDLSSGEAKEFDIERTERARLVENSTSDSVWVMPIKHFPKTIFFGDIGIYPEPWYDNFYAQYYGKKSISLIKK